MEDFAIEPLQHRRCLTPGVEFFMNIFQSLLVNMSIYLGSRNVGMTKHQLY